VGRIKESRLRQGGAQAAGKSIAIQMYNNLVRRRVATVYAETNDSRAVDLGTTDNPGRNVNPFGGGGVSFGV
jgi:hypothetical protein